MTRGSWHGALRRRIDDEGSVSLWVVIFAFTTIALLILVVDGGQVMNDKSRAADIGEQAARAAADDLDTGQLRAGTVALAGGACDLQNGPAANLVAAYAKGVPGVTASLTGCQPGTTTVAGQQELSVTVTVHLSAPPALPVGAFSTINATATETAFVACGNADVQEAC
jgi:Flp pilus assembly protein TadG